MLVIGQPLQLTFGFELRIARLVDIREGNGQSVQIMHMLAKCPEPVGCGVRQNLDHVE